MKWSRILPVLVTLFLVLFLLSLRTASRPFQYIPPFWEELFPFAPEKERLNLPQAEPGQEDPVEMVLVPAGPFIVGIEDQERGWTRRQVVLDGFWIDVHEVTNRQYSRFVKAIGYDEPPYYDSARYNHPDAPVVAVSWFDARAYCWWTRKRLPSETEWEKAARGTDGLLFPWGNEFRADRANLLGKQDGFPEVAPAGRFPDGASPFGALDMVGNVWEWCGDWYDPNYYRKMSERNPRGPRRGHHRVLRGGSWVSAPDFVRGFVRDRLDPYARGVHFGFRCARSVD